LVFRIKPSETREKFSDGLSRHDVKAHSKPDYSPFESNLAGSYREKFCGSRKLVASWLGLVLFGTISACNNKKLDEKFLFSRALSFSRHLYPTNIRISIYRPWKQWH